MGSVRQENVVCFTPRFGGRVASDSNRKTRFIFYGENDRLERKSGQSEPNLVATFRFFYRKTAEKGVVRGE